MWNSLPIQVVTARSVLVFERRLGTQRSEEPFKNVADAELPASRCMCTTDSSFDRILESTEEATGVWRQKRTCKNLSIVGGHPVMESNAYTILPFFGRIWNKCWIKFY